MSAFDAPDEFADLMDEREAPFPFGALVLLLRHRVGTRHVSLINLCGELLVGSAVALTVRWVGADPDLKLGRPADGPVLLALVVLAVGTGAAIQVWAKVQSLRRYAPVHRHFSGTPRLYAFPPDRWLERAAALEERRPRTARALVRLLVPLYRFRIWVSRRPAWAVKTFVEPALLLATGLGLLACSYLLHAPFWLPGAYAVLAAVVLSFEEVSRSLDIYESLRAVEDATTAGNNLAERLRRRRGGY